MKKLLIAAIILFTGTQVFAKQVEVLPLRSELTVAAGAKAEGVFKVKNVTDNELEIIVDAKDWFVLPENMDINIDEWLSINPERFKLKGGEVKEVPYKLSIPDDASGELAAKVSFLPAGGQKNGLIVIMSVSLYVFVKGTEKCAVEISRKLIRKEENGYAVSIVLKNKGNIHVRPRGKVTISKGRKVVKEVDLDYGWPIYPNKDRGFVGRWSGGALAKGKYKAHVKVDLGFNDMVVNQDFKFKVGKTGEVANIK